MSAYMVDRNHIRYLVEAAASRRLFPDHGHLTWVWDIDRPAGSYQRGELCPGQSQRAAKVGQMLWDENHASVCARYPDSDKLPGPTDQDFVYGEHRHAHNGVEPVAVIKACDCYEYQACEHDGWNASEAKAFIYSLRGAACRALPGYDDAPWGAPQLRPTIAA